MRQVKRKYYTDRRQRKKSKEDSDDGVESENNGTGP